MAFAHKRSKLWHANRSEFQCGFQIDLVLLAAPMPGLEPQNISVSITDRVVQTKGEERGPRQHELDLKLAE
jgi:hypothetical protein